MSASNLVDPLTNKIYDQYIPQGGGVSLTKGQLITANGAGTEVAFPTVAPADGSILSYDSTELFGLKYIAVPGVTPLDYQQLISANPANQSAIVPAPAQNNYVLTSDNTLGAGSAGLKWAPATGGGGLIQTKLPLFTDNTTNPHTIGINFTASVGEIPYGNGTAQVGALTVAPNIASSNQFLGTVLGVPTWKDVGASGTITATAPLTEYAIASASNIAIDFTSIGDLVVGGGAQVGGNPVAGVILPSGTEGQILSVASTGIGGLKWIDNTQHTGQEIIVRSNALTVAIAPPTDPKDTLILVAEETNSSWDAIGLDITFTGDYDCEFATGNVGDPGSSGSFVGLINTIDGFRVVELWTQPSGSPGATKRGYFAFYGYQYGVNQPSDNAYVRVAEAFAGTGSNLDGNVLLGGHFNTFVYTSPVISPPPNVIAYNICKVGIVSETVQNLDTVSNATGLGTDWAQRDSGGDYGVFSINYIPAGVWANPRPTVWIMGKFQSILYEGTQSSIDGYRSMARYFPEANGTAEYQSVANTTDLGYGVMNATYGTIYDAYFYGNYCAIVGSFTGLYNGNPLIPIPVPAGMTGFAVMDVTQSVANRWGSTPTGPVLVAQGNCIRPSLALANNLIIGQSSTAGPVLYDTTTNATSATTPSSPATFPAGMSWNSITSGTIVIVGGNPAVAIDALYMITDGTQPSYVYYLTTATGSVAQQLTPAPTGVVAGDVDGIISGFGIKINFTQDFPQNVMIISGATSLYQYDPAVPHANIDFTLANPNGFRSGNTITNTARFAQPAYQSQSYISSADKVYWIQTGGTTTGLTYF